MFGRIQFLQSIPPHSPQKIHTHTKTYPPTFPFNSGESGGIHCSED